MFHSITGMEKVIPVNMYRNCYRYYLKKICSFPVKVHRLWMFPVKVIRPPVPPAIVIKSNGSEGYVTTDIATILQRQQDFKPDRIWYVVDFRQNLHFTQVFRTAQKAELVPASTELTHLCFGTVNGKDGKPFKTRDGGIMQLSELLDTVVNCSYEKLRNTDDIDMNFKKETAEKIGIAAIKFGDLINHYSKDCVFDIDKFMASEGKTGVYLLYTVARINSILKRIDSLDLTAPQSYGIYSQKRAGAFAEAGPER